MSPRLGLIVQSGLWCGWITVACVAWLGQSALPAVAEAPRVAAFRADVTPPIGSPLVGGWVKPTIAIDDPLWAKGIVLEADGRRYVLCAVDYCEIRNASHTFFREQLAAAAGTDAARVAVQSLHQHTAPMIDEPAQKLLDASPQPLPCCDMAHFRQAVADTAAAVRQAVARLEPFDSLAVGTAEVEHFASNRRVMGADGKIMIRWSATKEPALQAAPEGLVDRNLRTISFLAGGRPLARLHYYASHPQSYYSDGRITSDTVGLARERVEQEEKVPQIYFTGCSGDITAGKYNDGSPQARGELTDRLAAGMRAAIAASKPIAMGPIEWRTTPLAMPPRLDEPYTLAAARAVLDDAKSSPSHRINKGAMLVAWIDRQQTPIELSSLSIGPVTIVHLPGEPFVMYQLLAQKLGGGRFVAVAGYGDGGCGYLCSEAAYAEGGYEPTASFVGPRSQYALEEAIERLVPSEK
ncbi:MAG TPA: hypothetical protein VMF30_07085 [Pirellulales bacterium]|nr:hypothetical protein [Pirellulales bacterium]